MLTENLFSLHDLLSMDGTDVDDVKTAYIQRKSSPDVVFSIFVRPHRKKFLSMASPQWQAMVTKDYGRTWRCFRTYPTTQEMKTAWLITK